MAALSVSLVLGGLVVLVPEQAQAAKVVTSAAGIGQLYGPSAGPFSFDITTTIEIPKGEFIPVSYAQVRVAKPGASAPNLSNSLITHTHLCIAETTATSGPRAEVIAVKGAEAKHGTFNGYAYTVTGTGMSFSFGSQSAVNFGYGYGYGTGYGSETSDLTLQVTLRVTGCIGPHGSSAPLTFGANQHKEQVWVQAAVGADSTRYFPGIPQHKWFTNPDAKDKKVMDDPGNAELEPGSHSNSDGTKAVGFSFGDKSGNNEKTPKGTLLTAEFPPGMDAKAAKGFTVHTLQDLPAGTQLTFEFKDDGTKQSLDSVLCGMPTGPVLKSRLGQSTPAFYMCIRMSVPGEGDVSPTGRVVLTLDLLVSDEYLRENNYRAQNFQLRGFDSDGNLKPHQPTRTKGPVAGKVAGKDYFHYTFSISEFSSFAGISRPLSGGGGAGGVTLPSPPAAETPATPVTPAPVPPVSPETPPTTPETPPVTTPPTGPVAQPPVFQPPANPPPTTTDPDGGDKSRDPPKKKGVPGVELGLLAAALAAIAVVARRRQ
ncbi:MAG TPA: hypothetical protein VFH47_07215 [Candidatus Thermoplasmatota archaeon]|nr:hypothetical protein [Candidatus Thermoplasmatota archaeon]